MKLTKKQRYILLGTVLGDAYLQKTGAKNARLRLEHSGAQKKYLLWKVEEFPKLFQGKPKYMERIHPYTKKRYSYWRHQSSATPELELWRKKFYVNNKKQIPEDFGKLLTDTLSLAVWYMDDGYYYEKDRNSYLYLGKVSEREAFIVQRTLEENFGIKSRIYNKKQKGFAIYFPVEETIKMHKMIKKYVLPLFDYKLSPSVK